MGWLEIFDWLIYSNLIEAQAAAGVLTMCTGKMPTCSTSSQAKRTAPTEDGSEGKQMYCKICLKFDPHSAGAFVRGTDKMKKENVAAHNISHGHKNSVKKMEKKIVKDGLAEEDSEAYRALQQLDEKQKEKLVFLFRNANSVAKRFRPYTDYVALCELDKDKGFDIGTTYINQNGSKMFKSPIADELRYNTRKDFNNVNFISFICDGTTDRSVTEAEILYTRWSDKGEIHVNFVAVKNVERADAASIQQALSLALDKSYGDSWRNKLVSVGTFGASVMMGNRDGLVA